MLPAPVIRDVVLDIDALIPSINNSIFQLFKHSCKVHNIDSFVQIEILKQLNIKQMDYKN